MKKILLLSLFIANTAIAEGMTFEKCTKFGEFAATVMEARQSGVPMSKVWEIMGDTNLGKKIIQDAYEMPRFNSYDIKQRTINNFRDEYFGYCAKGI